MAKVVWYRWAEAVCMCCKFPKDFVDNSALMLTAVMKFWQGPWICLFAYLGRRVSGVANVTHLPMITAWYDFTRIAICFVFDKGFLIELRGMINLGDWTFLKMEHMAARGWWWGLNQPHNSLKMNVNQNILENIVNLYVCLS